MPATTLQEAFARSARQVRSEEVILGAVRRRGFVGAALLIIALIGNVHLTACSSTRVAALDEAVSQPKPSTAHLGLRLVVGGFVERFMRTWLAKRHPRH